MIRELDSLALAFSLWEQARHELRAVEEELVRARHARPPLSLEQLNTLDTRLRDLNDRTDKLLQQALRELRTYTSAGFKGV